MPHQIGKSYTFLDSIVNITIKHFVVIVAIFTFFFAMRTVEIFKYPQTINTFASALMTFVMCLVFIKKRNLLQRQNLLSNCFLYYILIYFAIGFIKLCFIPSTLYPINQADALFSLSLLFGILFYSSAYFIKGISKLYFRYIIPIFILLCPFTSTTNYADLLGFNLFFFLLFPYLNKRKKIIVISIIILSILTTSQRIYYMRYAFFFLLLILFYTSKLSQRFYAIVHKIMFAIPLISIVLAIWFGFNVFDFQSYLGHGKEIYNVAEDRVENTLDDTRTFIYLEAIESAKDGEYLTFGRTPYYGYDSFFQSDRMSKLGFIVLGSHIERISEVHMESIFTWFGFLGLIFYMCVLYKMSSKCIVCAKNKFSPIIGLAVGLMWIMLWIEYSFSFTPSCFVYPLVLSMAYNTDLQALNDFQIKEYFYKSIN